MNEHARDLALMSAIEFYTKAGEKKRRKRKKAVPSKTVTYSWEISPYVGNDPVSKELGLDNLSALTRLILQYYMYYKEVPSPVYDEDGNVQLDRFGRPRAAAKCKMEDAELSLEVQDRIARGAVWFTKSTIYRAWEGLFGEGFYQELYPHGYNPPIPDGLPLAEYYRRYQEWAVRSGGTLADNSPRGRPKLIPTTLKSHRSDRLFLRLLKEGRLIRCPHKQGRFMFSKEMCVAAQLPEAWDVHLERGERWEGLIYQNHVVDLRTIYPQKRYKRDADLVIRKEPRSTGLHLKHPNQARWQRVLDKMQKHLLFDIDIVIQYAIEEGLFTADTVRKTTASEHLKTWVDNGKIKRIFSGYYRSEMFWRWNAKRNEHDPPRLPQTLDWMLSFAFWQAPRQYHIPNLTFTLQEVVNWLESQPEEKRKQWFGDRPLRRGMITERLRAYLEKDYVEVAANRKWRLSSYMITNTRPRWSKPGDDLEPVLPGSYKRRAILLSSMPIDQAIKQIAGDEHMGILHMMTTRILKDEDQSLLDGRLAKLAKRTFLKSRPNLLKAYMDGKLDEEY